MPNINKISPMVIQISQERTNFEVLSLGEEPRVYCEVYM